MADGTGRIETGSGLAGSGTDTDEGSELFGRRALAEEVGSNQQRSRRGGANAWDGLQKVKQGLIGLANAMLLSGFEIFDGLLE
jgi:hypothetical protein